jgi:hypothetical protein
MTKKPTPVPPPPPNLGIPETGIIGNNGKGSSKRR